jgi:hypothetical protein
MGRKGDRIICKKAHNENCIAQRSQEGYWDEFWMMGLFCMGLNTLNN